MGQQAGVGDVSEEAVVCGAVICLVLERCSGDGGDGKDNGPEVWVLIPLGNGDEREVFDLMKETGFIEEDVEEPSFTTLEPTS